MSVRSRSLPPPSPPGPVKGARRIKLHQERGVRPSLSVRHAVDQMGGWQAGETDYEDVYGYCGRPPF